MRLQAIIIGLLFIGQLGCSDDNIGISSFEDDTSISTLNGKWRVHSFENYTTQTIEYKTQENSWNKDIIVKFDDSKDPHEFSGVNTTNGVFGEFDYVSARQFKLRRLGTTFAGQPKWGDEFAKAVLDGDVTFRINSKGLRIYYDNKTKSVTLTKE